MAEELLNDSRSRELEEILVTATLNLAKIHHKKKADE
jgi:hypothetical protein